MSEALNDMNAVQEPITIIPIDTNEIISKKQTTRFIVASNFTGTKSLSDILAKLALAEINNADAMNGTSN